MTSVPPVSHSSYTVFPATVLEKSVVAIITSFYGSTPSIAPPSRWLSFRFKRRSMRWHLSELEYCCWGSLYLNPYSDLKRICLFPTISPNFITYMPRYTRPRADEYVYILLYHTTRPTDAPLDFHTTVASRHDGSISRYGSVSSSGTYSRSAFDQTYS
jgi:hypothetical protein